MKKLLNTLLFSTALASVSIGMVAAAEFTDADSTEFVSSSLHGPLNSIEKSEFTQDVAPKNDTFPALIPGYVRTLPANASSRDISMAVDAAQAAYDAYKLKAGPEADEAMAVYFKKHGYDGYNVRTFKGDTGHTVLTHALKNTSTIGLFAVNEAADQAILSFRGTKNKSDLITDFYALNGKFIKSRFDGEDKGGIHAGFNLVFKSYKAELEKFFYDFMTKKTLSGGKKKILISGHSLGGALSELSARYLGKLAKTMGVSDQVEFKVVTFNAPRVGSPEHTNRLHDAIGGSQNCIPFVREGDPVSKALLGTLGNKRSGVAPIVVKSSSWNPVQAHSFNNFKNGAAEAAFEEYNANPMKALGVRGHMDENPVGHAVMKGARYVKDNVLNPLYDAAVNAPAKIASVAKSAGAKLGDLAAEAKKLPEKAKSAFVSGFQGFRKSIAGFFGY